MAQRRVRPRAGWDADHPRGRCSCKWANSLRLTAAPRLQVVQILTQPVGPWGGGRRLLAGVGARAAARKQQYQDGHDHYSRKHPGFCEPCRAASTVLNRGHLPSGDFTVVKAEGGQGRPSN